MSIGADIMSATSLSLSIHTSLYGCNSDIHVLEHVPISCSFRIPQPGIHNCVLNIHQLYGFRLSYIYHSCIQTFANSSTMHSYLCMYACRLINYAVILLNIHQLCIHILVHSSVKHSHFCTFISHTGTCIL